MIFLAIYLLIHHFLHKIFFLQIDLFITFMMGCVGGPSQGNPDDDYEQHWLHRSPLLQVFLLFINITDQH
jgi:hypothetical protein